MQISDGTEEEQFRVWEINLECAGNRFRWWGTDLEGGELIRVCLELIVIGTGKLCWNQKVPLVCWFKICLTCHHNSFHTIIPTTMPKSILKHSKSVINIKPPKLILKMSKSLTNIKRPWKKVLFIDLHTLNFKQRLMHECDWLLDIINGGTGRMMWRNVSLNTGWLMRIFSWWSMNSTNSRLMTHSQLTKFNNPFSKIFMIYFYKLFIQLASFELDRIYKEGRNVWSEGCVRIVIKHL